MERKSQKTQVCPPLLHPCVEIRYLIVIRSNFDGFKIQKPHLILGVVHKLRLQDVQLLSMFIPYKMSMEGGRWSKNVHFLSMFIPYKMSTEGDKWSKKVKILSTQFVNDPYNNYNTYFSSSTGIPVPTPTSWLTPIPKKLF